MEEKRMIEEKNLMTEMNFGMLIKDILDECNKLEFKLEFGEDHCVLNTGEIQMPFYNLERLQGFLEGVAYVDTYMIEDVEDDGE